MTWCARCDWQPMPDAVDDNDQPVPPAVQLRWHAYEAQHPLCTCCGHSLEDTHPQTCEPCITKTGELLSGVIALWADLPGELGHAKVQKYDHSRGGGDEHALPGGTILALLSPGSDGQAARRLTTSDKAAGLTGREHAPDNRPEDAPSIAWTLASWEQDWRDMRGEDHDAPPMSTPAVTLAAARYLEQHNRWAANTHPAYAEYADEIQGLHARLEVALGRVRRPVKAGANCFECTGTLIRPVGDDGLEDERHVVCRTCGEVYDAARYNLALAAKLDEGSRMDIAGQAYATVGVLAKMLDRSERTLRAWADDEDVPLDSYTLRGVRFLNVGQATAQNELRPKGRGGARRAAVA